jgi:hypothetical protein
MERMNPIRTPKAILSVILAHIELGDSRSGVTEIEESGKFPQII